MYYLIIILIIILLLVIFSKEKFIDIILPEDIYGTSTGHNTNKNKNRYFA